MVLYPIKDINESALINIRVIMCEPDGILRILPDDNVAPLYQVKPEPNLALPR